MSSSQGVLAFTTPHGLAKVIELFGLGSSNHHSFLCSIHSTNVALTVCRALCSAFGVEKSTSPFLPSVEALECPKHGQIRMSTVA